SALARRRQATPRGAQPSRANSPRAAACDQRGALSSSLAPPLAGRAHLHSGENDDRGSRQEASSQCGTLSETLRGNGAAVLRFSRGDCRNLGLCRAHRIFAKTKKKPKPGGSRSRREKPRSSIWKI